MNLSDDIPHGFLFDPRYGHTLEMLRSIRAPDTAPPDFDDFWRGLHARSQAVPLQLEIEERPCPWPGLRLLLVHYRVWPDYRVGAWVLLPAGGPRPRLAIVVGHGYGGRAEPEPGRAGPDRAVIFPVAPGFHISADPRLPLNDASRHVIHGIGSPHTYVLGSCAAALWRAVDVLEALLEGRPERIHYIGWSFGGGMGALMLPWETRYQSAELGQVTFANHPFRLRHECVGSGAAVRALWLEQPEIEQTLRYYEAATALTRCRIPVAFGCALFDPAVPPPGQWSAANAHPGPKIISAFPVGHFPDGHPGQAAADRAHQQAVEAFFGFSSLTS